MIKKIAIIAVTLALLLAFVSCSKPDNADDSVTTTPDGSTSVTDSANLDVPAVKAYDYDLSKYVKIGKYKGVEVNVPAITITDEDIQNEIEYVLMSNSTSNNITEGVVASGDIINIDYKGMKDGVAFDGGTDTGYNLTIGSGSFIPGFEDGLIGKEIGSTVSLDITFPENYSNNPDMAGVAVVFEVKLNHKVELIKPEWNDELIQKISKDCKTTAEYTEFLKTKIAEDKKRQAESNKSNAVWSKIIETAEVLEYPETELSKCRSDFMEFYNKSAKDAGKTLEDFLKSEHDITVEELNTKADEYAQGYVRDDLIFYYIVRTEKLTVTQDDYDAGLQEYFQYYQSQGFTSVSEFETYYGKQTIETSLLWDKMIDFITVNAVEITE